MKDIMKDIIRLETTELTVSAFINNTRVGYLCLASTEVDEDEYMGGFTYILVESVDVEVKHQRKGVYTAMINEVVKNLKEDEYLISMGRSNEASYFWANRFDLNEETVEIDVKKDQQENVIMIDSDNDYSIKEVSDFHNIDFF